MKTINISDETYEKIKNQLNEQDYNVTKLDELVGKRFFFRTVTYHLVGEVTGRIGNFLRLENASWIADSGRFMNAIVDGTLKEIEPVGVAWINLDTVTDFFPWKHPLPEDQK